MMEEWEGFWEKDSALLWWRILTLTGLFAEMLMLVPLAVCALRLKAGAEPSFRWVLICGA